MVLLYLLMTNHFLNPSYLYYLIFVFDDVFLFHVQLDYDQYDVLLKILLLYVNNYLLILMMVMNFDYHHNHVHDLSLLLLQDQYHLYRIHYHHENQLMIVHYQLYLLVKIKYIQVIDNVYQVHHNNQEEYREEEIY